MNEQLFLQAYTLLQKYTLEELRTTKETLIDFLDATRYERLINSQLISKTIHNKNRSNQIIRKRVNYIDEHLLPQKTSNLSKPIIEEYAHLKKGGLIRVLSLIEEKKRLTSSISEHTLKAKMMIRNLTFIFQEEKSINSNYETLDLAENLFLFCLENQINYNNLTDVEQRKLYNEYMKAQT